MCVNVSAVHSFFVMKHFSSIPQCYASFVVLLLVNHTDCQHLQTLTSTVYFCMQRA